MKHLGIRTVPPGLFDTERMVFIKNKSDSGQRTFCNCISGKDIGAYNTCPHLCEYCYANASKELAVQAWKNHQENRFGETITGG